VGIRADGRTLTVELARPASYFPAVAAVPTLAVVPESIATLSSGPEPGRAFPASGPYVPLEATRTAVVMEANDDYWAGPPPIDRITVVTDIGGRSEIDVFEDGAVDWTRITADDAAWIRYDERLGPQLRYGDEMVVELLGFDTAEPPFDDPAVRRAVAMAVDWRRLPAGGTSDPAPGSDPAAGSHPPATSGADGTNGVPDAAGSSAVTSIVPPGIPGRGEIDYVPPHDPEAARATLTAAGYPGGTGFPSVTLATYGVGPVDAIADEIERELGIEVEVETWSFDDHEVILATDPPAMWTVAWSADYPHAHDFLGLLLRSDSSANAGSWSDSAYDALIARAAASEDADEQERLYGQAQSILRDEVPLIPLGYGSSWALSRDGLAGSDVSGVGLVRFADLAWR
jgi:oligopeptide transport system substrate-binding protein